MATQIRTLDDGAWVSVNNSREVGPADVWDLAGHDVCECRTAAFLVEAFVEVGAVGRRVDAKVVGRCIDCGDGGVTDWLPMGRVEDGEFLAAAFDSVTPVPDREGRSDGG